jgi:hypothetical protein
MGRQAADSRLEKAALRDQEAAAGYLKDRTPLIKTMCFLKTLIALFILATVVPARAQDDEEKAKKEVVSPSPDKQFAFLYESSSEDGKSYDLIERKSGKVLERVMEQGTDPSASERFSMDALWRKDSKAVALTCRLWKRGTVVDVYLKSGDTFVKVELPELEAEIPDRLTDGKDLQHIYILNSQTAVRWLNSGSLVVTIENGVDGGGGQVIAKRTVELGFDKAGKATIQKSSVKYSAEK